MSTRLATVINPGLSFDFAKVNRRNFIDDELLKRLESLEVPPARRPATPHSCTALGSISRVSNHYPKRFAASSPTPIKTRAPSWSMNCSPSPSSCCSGGSSWAISGGISSARQGNSSYQYQAWVDDCLRKNRPWDEVVRTLLTALGDPMDLEKGGPVSYALDAVEANAQAS